jgi:hypothetical protein
MLLANVMRDRITSLKRANEVATKCRQCKRSKYRSVAP